MATEAPRAELVSITCKGQDDKRALKFDGSRLCDIDMRGPNGDRARTLVRTLNCHDELLAAAKRALSVLRAQGESTRPGNVLGALESAIAKATR